MTKLLLPEESIRDKIFVMRGRQVMLDRDLALIYQVKPIRLREQVKRNLERFPDDFMFQLTPEEVDLMVSQIAIPSRGVLGGHLPYAFTEQGVASLSGVLHSNKAIQVSLHIMRTFVEMRRVVQESALLITRVDQLEANQREAAQKFEQIFQALESHNPLPKQGIFFDGQVYDAYQFACDLIRSAKVSIVLIDNYVDDSVLTMLAKRRQGVTARIYSRVISKQLRLDLEKHKAQYPAIEVEELKSAHDRFLILDGTQVYHLGASLKDLGKQWFAFSKIGQGALGLMDRLKA